MRSIRFGVLLGGLLAVAQMNAQVPMFAGLASEPVLGSAIGPDGTYYALTAAANSTPQNPSTELLAIGNTGGNAPKWTAILPGRIGQILPGATSVFVVQSVTSGTGRNTTTTTSVQLLAAATGAHVTSIAPAGNITEIQVRTIGGSDYLYVSTFTLAATSGGSATFSSARTLTIYSASGAVIKTAAL
jgi:hypothetical protein